MMCLCTSRLRIGRPPDAEGLGYSRAGKLIWVFNGPREGIACAGRQSLGQWEGDISACGGKSSSSPWSFPPGEEKPSADSGFGVEQIRRSIDKARRLEARLKFDLERWEFDRKRKLKQMAAREQQRAVDQGESKLIRVKNFHRGDAETPREYGMGDGARERVGVFCDGGRGGSNLVQLKISSGALGNGTQTFPGGAEYSRSAGLLYNISAGAVAEGVKNWVRRGDPGFGAYRCRNPENATVPGAMRGRPAHASGSNPLSFVPEEHGGTPSSTTGTVALPSDYGGFCADVLGGLPGCVFPLAMASVRRT